MVQGQNDSGGTLEELLLTPQGYILKPILTPLGVSIRAPILHVVCGRGSFRQSVH